MEYSFLEEKSYFEQPTRSLDGSIENINTYAVFFTPRLIIKYDKMNIEDYRKLMRLLQSKNEFTVTCYDVVSNERVTHKMYAAPTQMPVIYQQYLKALGIKEFSLELIGTNNGVKTNKVTYNFNIPSGYASKFSKTSAEQIFAKNASGIIGQSAIYTVDETTYSLDSEKTKELLDNKYTFQGWNTQQDGKGFTYIDGDAYFIYSDTTLYAIWR
jgi:glutamine cyclotransferase